MSGDTDWLKARADQIDTLLAALRPAWPHLSALMQERIDDWTLTLIGANDEQLRGRIKALRELLELPETLQQERERLAQD